MAIYFIEDHEGNVKIGRSRNVTRRMSTFQTAHVHPLKLLAVMHGGPAEEAGLHEEFRDYRISGEWFSGDVVRAALRNETENDQAIREVYAAAESRRRIRRARARAARIKARLASGNAYVETRRRVDGTVRVKRVECVTRDVRWAGENKPTTAACDNEPCYLSCQNQSRRDGRERLLVVCMECVALGRWDMLKREKGWSSFNGT